MKIIVTDLTRFTNREKVCLAGIDPSTGQCIRPMRLIEGGKTDYLVFESIKKHKVIPGSILEGDFSPIPNSHAPHVEDHSFNAGSLKVIGSATGNEFKQVLEQTSSPTVKLGFGSLPNSRLFVPTAPPPRSIMTLKLTNPKLQFRLSVDKYNNQKFKAHITDASGFQLSFLPVADLGISDHVASIRADDPTLDKLNTFLQGQDTLYIRLGLSRVFSAGNPPRNGFWVQANGIYSFPSHREDLRIYD